MNEKNDEKKKRVRRVQPVVVQVVEHDELAVGSEIEDKSIHDFATAKSFVTKSGLAGKFEVVRKMGSIETEAVTVRKVVVK